MIIGLILAGGRSRRFEGDKAEAILAGLSLAERVVARAAPQVDRLIISINDSVSHPVFESYPRLADTIGGFRGPLAGILTGLEWVMENLPDCPWLATFSVDAPFFPTDLVARLASTARRSVVPVTVASGGQSHPVFGLWPVALAPSLRRYLEAERGAAVKDFLRVSGGREISFPDVPYDPFFNINRRQDMIHAGEILHVLALMENDIDDDG